MRFDGRRYVDCRWCGGRGCLQCPNEADAAYKRAFPGGPKPIATFRLDSPEDMERARAAIGVEAIRKAFGPGGGGVREIEQNVADNVAPGEVNFP
jgi:hypothetical protein